MNYPRNSNQPPQKREKRIEAPVITGKVILRKPPMGKRMWNLFIQGNPRTAAKTTLFEGVIPSLSAVVLDSLKMGLDRLFMGDNVPVRRSTFAPTGNSPIAQFAYNKVQTQMQNRNVPGKPQSALTWQDRAMHNFDNIILEERAEGAAIIQHLQNLIDEYGQARVSDLYDAIGQTAEFTDDTWGWLDLNGAGVTYMSGGGYLLVVPRPVPLS